MFGYTLIKTGLVPFVKDVHALIARHPEYLDGIRKGVVHIGFNPGCREGMKQKPRAMTESAYRAEQDAKERSEVEGCEALRKLDL